MHNSSYFPGAGDVWFSLRNTTYQNNSCVALENIGEGDDALLCMTNLASCCQSSNEGSWFFPNGSKVYHFEDFNTSRGQMLVRLNRRRVRVEGIYRCEILNSTNVTLTIFIGVYNASAGESALLFSSNIIIFHCIYVAKECIRKTVLISFVHSM